MTASRARRLQPVVGARRSRRTAVVPGLLSLVALLAVTASVLLTGGPADIGTDGPRGLPAVEAVVAEAEDEAADDEFSEDVPIPLPLVAYELFLERDPFEPIVPEPPAADPSQPGSPADPSRPGSPVDPSRPSQPGGPTDPATPGANGGCTGTTEVVCDGRVITVLEVLEENGEAVVVLEIGTMRYRASVGDIVADVFEVVSISPERVQLLYGDRIVTVLVSDNALK